jgi:hypothetical protein
MRERCAPSDAYTGHSTYRSAQAGKAVVIVREHSSWYASGGRAENRGAAFELFVLRILEQDPEIELAADAMPYGPHGFDVLARRNGEPLLVNVNRRLRRQPSA